MSEHRPWWVWGCADDLTPRDLVNVRRLNLATLVWAIIFLATTWTVRNDESPEALIVPALVLLGAALLVVGVMWVRFLRAADELTRKLQHEAMAKAFLLGLASVLTVPLVQEGAERLAAPGWLEEVLDFLEPAMVMPLTYVVAMIRAQRRMRG